MSLKSLGLAASLSVLCLPALADTGTISIEDAYARTASPVSKSGAAFMQIVNSGTQDDRLIAARSDAAARIELHTHKKLGDGVMQMVEVEGGFPVPAGSTHGLERGGDHVMFMGLTASWSQGDMIPVTLTFEKAGDISLEIPVDLERKPMHGGMKNHGAASQN